MDLDKEDIENNSLDTSAEKSIKENSNDINSNKNNEKNSNIVHKESELDKFNKKLNINEDDDKNKKLYNEILIKDLEIKEDDFIIFNGKEFKKNERAMYFNLTIMPPKYLLI